MKVVLDTNVLISATFWEGEAFKIIRLIEEKKIACFISKQIIEEYIKVANSDELIEKANEKNLSIKLSAMKLIEICKIVEPGRKIDVVKEYPDDNKIIECAVEAKADYIVTYDAKHILPIKEFEGIRIVSPTEFLKITSSLQI